MRSSGIRAAWRACLVASAAIWSGGLAAGEPPTYLGAASCASSACHGSTQGFADSGIVHNEYLIWHRNDRHARAYQTLLLPASSRIAEALGGPPAHQDPQCLACHASAGRDASHGPRFQIDDGVDCETCHGPAEPWLQSHTRGLRQTKERVEQGLKPTWDPHWRAELCVSCHVGDAERPLKHEVMAAGHPPLNFELDTYLAVMPPHHRADWAAEIGKPAPAPLQHWLAGQAAAAGALLEQVGELQNSHSLLPDFASFDCYACHHDLQQARWNRQRAPGLRIGELRLADSALMSLQLWLDATAPETAREWLAARSRLNASLTKADRNGLESARIDLAALLGSVKGQGMPAIVDSPTRILRLLQLAGVRYRADFALAQQSVMLAGVLLETIEQGGTPLPQDLLGAMQQLRGSVADSLQFNPNQYANASYRFRMLAEELIVN